MVNVNPIAQTSATDDTSPQGNLSAYGVTAAKFHGFTKSFVEHGYIFGFVCARADLTYQQGINKMWLRSTVYDFYWPTFAHLGEQAVELREIYAQGSEADTTVFGYQERYAEYRYNLRRLQASSVALWLMVLWISGICPSSLKTPRFSTKSLLLKIRLLSALLLFPVSLSSCLT